ncbi:head GIN domain-containing protein [Zunongwangia sp.]|uniref:head GIN domain-containing protein n=1 Tax=Zunongwangia sp. TaxID=1965325 RepID=UPI003AA86D7C
MKKLLLTTVIICLAITTVNAQWWSSEEKIKGNGEVVTKSRKTSDYDKVSLTGFMDVILIKGKEGNLEIEAESNLQKYIITEVKGGQLKIKVQKGVNLIPSRNNSVKIKVPFEDLEEVSITGSGDIWNEDKITANNFELSITGSGDIVLDIEADKIKGNVTGSGDVVLKGMASYLDCKVTGSGDFDAFKLKTNTVDAQVSGSGDINVFAEEELNAKVLGSGDVTYKGNPTKENFKTFGSGDISKY